MSSLTKELSSRVGEAYGQKKEIELNPISAHCTYRYRSLVNSISKVYKQLSGSVSSHRGPLCDDEVVQSHFGARADKDAPKCAIAVQCVTVAVDNHPSLTADGRVANGERVIVKDDIR